MALGSFWKQFLDLLPSAPRYVATVVDYPSVGRYNVQLVGGGVVAVKGAAGFVPSSKVFISGGVIEGLAPPLTEVVIDI